MQFKAFDNEPLAGTVSRHSLPLAHLSAFAGGFFAVVATLALNGGGEWHLVMWPISGVVAALCLPGASAQLRGRFSMYFLGGAGVFAGCIVSRLPGEVAALLAGLTILDLTVMGLFLSPYIQTFDDLKKSHNGMRLVLGSVIAPLLSGLLGTIQIATFLKTSPLRMGATAALANTLGIVVCLPLVLFLATGKSLLQRRLPERPFRSLQCVAFFTLVCCGVFWQNSGSYLFLICPPMMLLLLFTGLEGALFSSLIITIVGCYATAHGHGPICMARTSSPEVRLITLQVFIWVSVVTALPVGAALDERRKAEFAATNSLSAQRTILKHVRDAIVLSSLDGRERYASAAIEALTGWTPAEYARLERLETVHPDDRARAIKMIVGFGDGIRETSLRYRLLHKNGEWRWVEASVSAYGEGVITGYVGTIRDSASLIETERGWMEERRIFSEEQQRLADAEHAAQYQLKLRDEFLSHVSHELRAPLTSIYSFCSIIADGLAGETTPEQEEYLDIVLKNVFQLQSMIEDLLTVTQSREGKLNIELQAASLPGSVIDAFDTVRSFANRKRIALTAEPFEDAPDVHADPVRVRQVLIILLDNAIKFTPEGGSVRVVISVHDSDCLVTRVIDTGRGIPKDKCDLVFNKLYQVGGPQQQDTSAAGRTGLGLGLHIAKDLIVRQSGHIWVTSVVGEGSVFHFTLPLYRHQATSSVVEDEPAKLMNLSGLADVGS